MPSSIVTRAPDGILRRALVRSRARGRASTLSVALLVSTASLVQAQQTGLHADAGVQATAGRIEIQIGGLRSARGKVFVALWRSAKKFPGKPPAGSPSRVVPIVNGVAQAVFEDIAPGEFAITVFHDEDGDTELKTNFIGIPKEGIGFSRDARARIGAPDFDDAKLVLKPGQTAKLKITIWYL